MHYYSFHIGDYLKDTRHLSNDEDLAYRRLLDIYYDTEQPITLETQSLSRRLQLGTDCLLSVLSEFFVKCEDGWHNPRCDAEIAAYHALCNRNKENGKLGGRPKKTQSVSSRNPVGTQSEPTGKPTMNHKPITNNNFSCHQPTANDSCPHQEIISLYAECLPELAQIRTWEGSRQKNLSARWRWVLADLAKKGKENDKNAGLEFFRRMFLYIQKSDFLMGRSGKWQASLPWIVKAENFAKIIEGQYENREAA